MSSAEEVPSPPLQPGSSLVQEDGSSQQPSSSSSSLSSSPSLHTQACLHIFRACELLQLWVARINLCIYVCMPQFLRLDVCCNGRNKRAHTYTHIHTHTHSLHDSSADRPHRVSITSCVYYHRVVRRGILRINSFFSSPNSPTVLLEACVLLACKACDRIRKLGVRRKRRKKKEEEEREAAEEEGKEVGEGGGRACVCVCEWRR